jgi:hypothetical protein
MRLGCKDEALKVTQLKLIGSSRKSKFSLEVNIAVCSFDGGQIGSAGKHGMFSDYRAFVRSEHIS